MKFYKKYVWVIVNVIIYAFVVLFAVVAIMGKYSLGGIKLLSVQSGSMEPALKTGSMVVVKSQANYLTNDIITFGNRYSSGKTITHRIVKIEEDGQGLIKFTTKGDANQSVDQDYVLRSSIIGKVAFSVPYLGYLTAFVRTPIGLLIVVIIPVIIIVFEEVKKMRNEAGEIIKRRKNRKKDDKEEPLTKKKNVEKVIVAKDTEKMSVKNRTEKKGKKNETID